MAEGVFYNAETKEYTTQEMQDDPTLSVSDEEKLGHIRQHRNSLLSETDFYALSDVTMSDEMRTYRQALRDLPASEGLDLDNPVFPTKP